MQHWAAERIEELTALVAAAAPDEDLTADELLTACFDRPGVVLGADEGAVAVGVGRDRSGVLVASVRLVAVHPDHRGRQVADSLLAAAEEWAVERGAARVELGGPAPFALWPGVPPEGALAVVADRRGYAAGGRTRSFTVGSSFRGPVPAGVALRRAVRDEDVTAVTLVVASQWPHLSDEVARALDHGTCHVAVATTPTDPDGRRGPVVGIGCHSVTRAAWVGPLVVVTDERRRGIGHALLGQVCRDLMIADFREAVVPGVGDDGTEAFLRAAGAEAGPTHVVMVRTLSG